MANVVVRVAIIQSRIPRIKVAQIEGAVALRKSSAEIVLRVRVGVVRYDGKARASELVGLEPDVERVVVREAGIPTIINGGEALIRTCQTGTGGSALSIIRIGRNERLAEIRLAAANLVDVLDVVQVNPVRAVVFERDYSPRA